MEFKIGDRVRIGEAAGAPWARGQAGVIEGFIRRDDGMVYMASVRLHNGCKWDAYLGNIEIVERYYENYDRYLKIEAWLRKRYTYINEHGDEMLYTVWLGKASQYTRIETALAHRYGIL